MKLQYRINRQLPKLTLYYIFESYHKAKRQRNGLLIDTHHSLDDNHADDTDGHSISVHMNIYMCICVRIFLTMPFSPALLCFNEDSRGSNLVRHVNVNVGQEPPRDSQLSYPVFSWPIQAQGGSGENHWRGHSVTPWCGKSVATFSTQLAVVINLPPATLHSSTARPSPRKNALRLHNSV